MGSFKRSRTALYTLLFSFSVDETLTGLPLGQVVRYEKILKEVIAASVLTALWALYAVFALASPRRWKVYVPTIAIEVGALSIVWLLMLGGAFLAMVEHDLWYDYSAYMTVYQRMNYPYAFTCWFSGSCDDLRAMIAFSWLSWIVLSLLLVLAVASPASKGALVPFMVPMHGSEQSGRQSMVVFDEEAFEYRTAGLIGRTSGSSEYASAAEDRPSTNEKSRLVEDTE
ncbi:hypothetical protein PENSPDRAFT_751343 [Peniophora sp. CONT]|nr:hypothetical protein PENSPDRAFT_751343 [Peniophora sp. CONT]